MGPSIIERIFFATGRYAAIAVVLAACWGLYIAGQEAMSVHEPDTRVTLSEVKESVSKAERAKESPKEPETLQEAAPEVRSSQRTSRRTWVARTCPSSKGGSSP